MSFENSAPHSTPALLALEDGCIFHGVSVGYQANTVGEVVFNTSMTGYQEILTDPSYAEQIVTLTYPHIGNVGVNPEDFESKHAQAAGLIIRNMSPISSNWRATQTLPQFLQEQKIVAIANIDTRRLTHILREKGALRGCIMTGDIDIEKAIANAQAFSGLNGKDLASEVSTKNKYVWTEASSVRKASTKIMEVGAPATTPHHIVVLDFGVKHNILRILANHNCKLTIVPAKTSADEIIKLKPDGIILSNGPGDPAACDYAIENTKILLTKKIPILGICLGFQILALAFGAKTKKMKFGHHGANHPVQNIKTKKVFITSQNHSFCVDEKTLPADLEITHVSLFDKTLQGFKHKTLPVIALQGHPEASPGPNDIVSLFDEFILLLNEASHRSPREASTRA